MNARHDLTAGGAFAVAGFLGSQPIDYALCALFVALFAGVAVVWFVKANKTPKQATARFRPQPPPERASG